MQINSRQAGLRRGGNSIWVYAVGNIVDLKMAEQVQLDSDRINRLIRNLNQFEAEDTICRAVAELAAQIGKCDQERSDTGGLCDRLQEIRRIAGQLGMCELDIAASNAIDCLHHNDGTATAATLARMIRVGDLSLCAVWDVEGLSV